MPPVTGEPQPGVEGARDAASREKGRPPDKKDEDDKTDEKFKNMVSEDDETDEGYKADTSTVQLSSASMSKPTKVMDKDSEQLGSFASRKGKGKLDSEEAYAYIPDVISEGTVHEETGKWNRARVVHSAWASIENACKISSSVLVSKLQCEHIADHFKVIAHVLKKLGLGKDFVCGQALEGGSGTQMNLTFDEMHFSHIARTFEDHFRIRGNGDHLRDPFRFMDLYILGTHVSSMFEDYVRELDALHGFKKKSIPKQFDYDEAFQDFIFQRMYTQEKVEPGSDDCIDEFLHVLLGVLKEGEDLVLFHSVLEGVNNEGLEWNGLYGEEFVQIYELLFRVIAFYACLEYCEGTQFVGGYLSRHDSRGAQLFRHYLNSICIGENTSLYIDDNFLNIEVATMVSKMLESPNGVLKAVYFKPPLRAKPTLQGPNQPFRFKLPFGANVEVQETPLRVKLPFRANVEVQAIRKRRLMVLAALSKCMSITSLTMRGSNEDEVHELSKTMRGSKDEVLELCKTMCGSNEDEVHELCKSLSVNKLLESLIISIDGLLTDDDAKYLSAMLKENHSLKSFTLQIDKINYEGCACWGEILVKNSSLNEFNLRCEALGVMAFDYLMSPLMANNDGEPHVNTSFKRLHIDLFGKTFLRALVVRIIAETLCTIETVIHFSINITEWNPNEACEILRSLKTNKALLVLDLKQSAGFQYLEVKKAFMDLLVNYNFTLRTIKMNGRDWNIEAFMKSKLEPDIIKEGLSSRVSGISKSLGVRIVHVEQAVERFQLKIGEGSTIEVPRPSIKASKEHQEELVVRHPSKLKIRSHGSVSKLAKPEVRSAFTSKLEIESEKSLRMLKPLLESPIIFTNFVLLRNLNMAQILQERYSKWNSFVEMYPSKLSDEEKDVINKGCITAALFPTTFIYCLKSRLLQGPNSRGILYMLKEVADLVVKKMKGLQDSGSQAFQFIDYVDPGAPLDIQHIYSPRKTIAIRQTFSTRAGIGGELQVENSVRHGIVQDHLTGAYYLQSGEASDLEEPNIDKPTGVLGVSVTSTEIRVEIMWEDGSCYSGALEDFSYDLEVDDNKQCALEAFGDLKGASFLSRTCGLKCSPLIIIALASAVHKEGLTLTWSHGKGHMEVNSERPSRQPVGLEVLECQILYSGDINQLGEAMEWGMNQFDQNCASYGRDGQGVLKQDVDQNNHIPKSESEYLSAMTTLYNAAAQDKHKYSFGIKGLSFGFDASFEIKNAKTVETLALKVIMEKLWKMTRGYLIGKLNDKHKFLEEKLRQGSLYAERDLNYLVVHDGYTENHVSIYWAKECTNSSKLELKWLTDLFIKEGPEKVDSIFKRLKGETLKVERNGTQFLENPSQQQSKGLVKWFKHYSNKDKDNCKGTALQMVDTCGDNPYQVSSTDEWKHIVGLQPVCSKKFWWKASYMQAITYSRTKYSSGLLLSTYIVEEFEMKLGSCTRRSEPGDEDYVHYTDVVKSRAKFSRSPQSLNRSAKWHEMVYWG